VAGAPCRCRRGCCTHFRQYPHGDMRPRRDGADAGRGRGCMALAQPRDACRRAGSGGERRLHRRSVGGDRGRVLVVFRRVCGHRLGRPRTPGAAGARGQHGRTADGGARAGRRYIGAGSRRRPVVPASLAGRAAGQCNRDPPRQLGRDAARAAWRQRRRAARPAECAGSCDSRDREFRIRRGGRHPFINLRAAVGSGGCAGSAVSAGRPNDPGQARSG